MTYGFRPEIPPRRTVVAPVGEMCVEEEFPVCNHDQSGSILMLAV